MGESESDAIIVSNARSLSAAIVRWVRLPSRKALPVIWSG